MVLTKDQEKAKNLILSHTNVFLTGGAGTGKSYVLQQVIAKLPADKTIVCAPTGKAAIHVGGVTIHRFLGIRPDMNITGSRPNTIPKKLENVETVIVDEISMCRSDLFNWLSWTLKLAEQRYKHNIQLVVVGDFCQLSPVVKTKAEKEMFANGKAYAFNTNEWKDWNFHTVVLHKIIRQNSQEFIKALNSIRIGETKYINYLNSNGSNEPLKDAITIVSKNSRADTINNQKLNSLNGNSKLYTADSWGKLTAQDRPAPTEIMLKVGAQVVFVANGRGYSNGTMAKVTALRNEYVRVKTENNTEIDVFPYTWSIYNYEVKTVNGRKKLDKVETGEYTQIPLKLGYAVTIHKSQGQTYSAANLEPAGWASGLLYVALSRVTDIKKLHLIKKIEPNMVRTDQAVIDFYKKIDQEAPRPKNESKSVPIQISKYIQTRDIEMNNRKSKLKSESHRAPEQLTLDLQMPELDEPQKQKPKTENTWGGKRSHSGRKASYDGLSTIPMRIPAIMQNDMQELKKLDKDKIKIVEKSLQDVLRMQIG